jgi:hypothetical protein
MPGRVGVKRRNALSRVLETAHVSEIAGETGIVAALGEGGA